MGLTVIMIQIAVRTGRVPGLGKALAMTGVYSYSIYLFHQPYVMYAGDKLQSYHIGVYLILAAAIIAAIVMISMCVEYAINLLVSKLPTT
jgi:peptidoglycan/LPS O-acetylase OafA/YrhL